MVTRTMIKTLRTTVGYDIVVFGEMPEGEEIEIGYIRSDSTECRYRAYSAIGSNAEFYRIPAAIEWLRDTWNSELEDE